MNMFRLADKIPHAHTSKTTRLARRQNIWFLLIHCDDDQDHNCEAYENDQQVSVAQLAGGEVELEIVGAGRSV